MVIRLRTSSPIGICYLEHIYSGVGPNFSQFSSWRFSRAIYNTISKYKGSQRRTECVGQQPLRPRNQQSWLSPALSASDISGSRWSKCNSRFTAGLEIPCFCLTQNELDWSLYIRRIEFHHKIEGSSRCHQRCHQILNYQLSVHQVHIWVDSSRLLIKF